MKKIAVGRSRCKVQTEFTGKRLTRLGGAGLFADFLDKLGLVRRLLACRYGHKVRLRGYATWHMLLSVLWGLICNEGRQKGIAALGADGVFRLLSGLTDMPCQSTLSRFFSRVRMALVGFLDWLNVELLLSVRGERFWSEGVTIDLDTHVKTVYGSQQRARKGYNPKKRGRKSYLPMVAFIAETRDFLYGRFRPGHRPNGGEIKRFVKACRKRLGERVSTIRLRADSGFYSEAVLRYLEWHQMPYALAVPLYAHLQPNLYYADFTPIGGAWSVAELRLGGPSSRRYIAVREEIRPDGKRKKQLSLFDVPRYNFQLIVTNRDDCSAERAWQWYNERANVENLIKETAYSLPGDVNISHSYAGNAVFFYLCHLAHNLFNWFQDRGLAADSPKSTATTLRQRFLFIAGRLVRRGRRWVIKLQQHWPYQEQFRRAEERLSTIALG